MADLLKVTTPVLNKSQPVQQNMPKDVTGVLNLQEASKVLQTHNQTNLAQNGNTTLENSSAPTMLLNLLKDPAVAASYLKNISFLEEIFKLLPANNNTITSEIEQLFHGMILTKEQIAPEMQNQGAESTILQGELFDFLRQLNNQAIPGSSLQYAIANFLRASNNLLCRSDILGAVYNNLKFLGNSMQSSKELSSKIDSLLNQLEHVKSNEDFSNVKRDILALLGSVESSILYDSKMDKVLSILKYNLSRYNTNATYFQEAALLLRQHLTGSQRKNFSTLSEAFWRSISAQQPQLSEKSNSNSLVMHTLTRLLSMRAGQENLSASDEAQIDQILHSLLSSPCNFTPLLHFIVPTQIQGVRAFAEIWVNPDSDEKDMPQGAGSGIHFLLVVDTEGVGRFETDVYVYGQTVDITLHCPPGSKRFFTQLPSGLAKTIQNLGYKTGNLQILPLERPRSLMEAFKSLPYKRMGLDVKI